MFINNNYALVSISNLKTFQDFLYYLIIFLTLPIVFSVLLLFPINYVLKVKNPYLFVFSITGILIFEYFLYTYLASQANFWNGIYNGVLSIILLALFFFKSIKDNLIKNKCKE